MKRKFVSVFLCVSLAMGMLAGCGGGSEEEVQKKDGDKPYAGEKLTVLYMSGVYADAANSMVDELKRKLERLWRLSISRIRHCMKNHFWI